MKKLELSQRHGPPLTELVDKKYAIFALRIGDRNIARVFSFYQQGQEIILTNGYVKKQQKVDAGELERARKYKKRLGGTAPMNETSKPYNEVDDYIAGFSDEERQEYLAAKTALDLACILYHLQHEQGLTQRQAAERAGLKQQAISRLEKAASNIQLGSCH